MFKKPLLVSMNDIMILLVCLLILIISVPVVSFYRGKISLLSMIILEVVIITAIAPLLKDIKRYK